MIRNMAGRKTEHTELSSRFKQKNRFLQSPRCEAQSMPFASRRAPEGQAEVQSSVSRVFFQNVLYNIALF